MSRFSNAEIIECYRDRSRIQAQIQIKERQVTSLEDELNRLHALDDLAESVTDIVDETIPIKMYGKKPDVEIQLVNPPTTRGIRRSAKIYLNRHNLRTYGLILEKWDNIPATECFCDYNYTSWAEAYALALDWIIRGKLPRVKP